MKPKRLVEFLLPANVHDSKLLPLPFQYLWVLCCSHKWKVKCTASLGNLFIANGLVQERQVISFYVPPRPAYRPSFGRSYLEDTFIETNFEVESRTVNDWLVMSDRGEGGSSMIVKKWSPFYWSVQPGKWQIAIILPLGLQRSEHLLLWGFVKVSVKSHCVINC